MSFYKRIFRQTSTECGKNLNIVFPSFCKHFVAAACENGLDTGITTSCENGFSMFGRLLSKVPANNLPAVTKRCTLILLLRNETKNFNLFRYSSEASFRVCRILPI